MHNYFMCIFFLTVYKNVRFPGMVQGNQNFDDKYSL